MYDQKIHNEQVKFEIDEMNNMLLDIKALLSRKGKIG